jgi:hypothetical protein
MEGLGGGEAQGVADPKKTKKQNNADVLCQFTQQYCTHIGPKNLTYTLMGFEP